MTLIVILKLIYYFVLNRASEQPDESQQNQNDDNSQADIFNQEEYEKIFRPQKEITRRKFYTTHILQL